MSGSDSLWYPDTMNCPLVFDKGRPSQLNSPMRYFSLLFIPRSLCKRTIKAYRREVLTEETMGQVLSCESSKDRGVDVLKRSTRQQLYKRHWQVCRVPRAVEGPMHVGTFFDRNLGDLGISPAQADRWSKAQAARST